MFSLVIGQPGKDVTGNEFKSIAIQKIPRQMPIYVHTDPVSP